MHMEFSEPYIIPAATIGALSIYDLLQHMGHIPEPGAAQGIIPLSLAIGDGTFTRQAANEDAPVVSVRQTENAIATACTCGGKTDGLCGHQAEVLSGIIEKHQYRVFFDAPLRRKILLRTAGDYGLENEPDLDKHFRITHTGADLLIEPIQPALIRVDERALLEELRPLPTAKPSDNEGRIILVVDKHRLYQQPSFTLMHAGTTQAGKIKNPIAQVDLLHLLCESQDPAVIKFIAALSSISQKAIDMHHPSDLQTLRIISANPMQLEVYQHDRSITDTVSIRSLVPISLHVQKAEIALSVFRKSPFYEITGKLRLQDIEIPFDKVTLRYQQFVVYRHGLYLLDNPNLTRVIRFFKRNNEMLYVHESKFEHFRQTALRSLEHLVHIDYSYIRPATAAQLAEKKRSAERLVYIQQQGVYIAITPVMKYGELEVPVYSLKQLTDTDQHGREYKVKRNSEAELDLTHLVMHQHPDFKEQIEEHEYFYLHKSKFLDNDWFLHAFEAWRAAGVTIMGFNNLPGINRSGHKASIRIMINSGIDWFNASVQVSFGGKRASLKYLNKAIRNKSKYVELGDGTTGLLPAEWIQRLAKFFQAGEIDAEMLKFPKSSFSEVSELFEKEMLDEAVQTEIAHFKKAFGPAGKIAPVTIPSGLQTELRHYQQDGLNWLHHLDNHNFGGCLADDMGLGKTIQVIAFILSLKAQNGHATHLVVAPTSVLFNWQAEIQRFAPELKVQLHHGPGRAKTAANMGKYDVILTSYGTLPADISILKSFRFDYIFLDESQAIKNPGSERYKAARLLQARNRIVITGTPVENNTVDLYGQLSFACPGLLGSKQYFKEIYAIPIDKFGFTKRAMELQRTVKPFILRRTKKQVALELPEKTELTIYCEMNAEQRKVYDACEQELRDYIAASTVEEIHKNSMHVLTGLTRLRLICNSPELLKEGLPAGNSVKIEVLTEQIVNKSREHKILVFSQFTGMLDLIQAELERLEIPFELLTGQTRNRGEKVNNFQTNGAIRVFLISLKAGGVGLNLTEADYVYIVDPWWNPATENQAIDRSHRIGQRKNVMAVRLICSGTVEEKIRHLQARKQQLAQDLIHTDATMLQHLSKAELLEIL